MTSGSISTPLLPKGVLPEHREGLPVPKVRGDGNLGQGNCQVARTLMWPLTAQQNSLSSTPDDIIAHTCFKAYSFERRQKEKPVCCA